MSESNESEWRESRREAERGQGRAEPGGDEMEWESKSVRMVSISLA